MFVNGLAMDVRGQLRPWTSKRYDWTLSTVGYILSAESFLGVFILMVLPWFDRARRSPEKSTPASLSTSPVPHPESPIEDETIAATRAAHAKRRRELLVARVSLGLGAAGALVIALASKRLIFLLGLAVMTGMVGFTDAMRGYFTAHFPTDDIQGLYASASVVETLSVIVGSPTWGAIYAHAYRGASQYIGVPFAMCAVLMICTLGLTLRLRA
ncbi:MAG: hypothetical protein Q9169_008461 [Polycauliona sp. 2 TL-2023]